jgi:hypothetical protein
MADLTDAQKKRQDARRKRRGQSEEPEQDDSSEAQSDTQNGEPLEAVKQAAKVAAAGAAVGAAAAAARALTQHGNDDRGEEREADEPEAQESQQKEPEAEQPEEQQPQSQQDEEPRDDEQHEPEPEPEREPEPVEGASLGDAGKAMRTARDQLQELLGKAVESVSGLERTQNGWVATLEVVELSRIPETTDVLGSYELELDENLGLRSYHQVRRYTRSQANGEGQ